MRKVFIAIMLMLPLLLLSATRTVSLDGTEQYISIQAAINACVSGDTVLVYPGRYLENLIIQTNNITLISLEFFTNNPAYIDSTIVDGNHVNACVRIYTDIRDIYIRGFSITNGFLAGAGGIGLFSYTDSHIENCKIFNNASRDGSGISINMCSVILSGVEIFDNHSSGMGGGIFIYGYMGSVQVTFDPVNRCSIYGNTAGAGQDIYAHSINNDLNIYLEMFTVSNSTSYYASSHRSSGNDFQLIFDIHTAYHEEINQDLYVSAIGDDSNNGLSPQTALKTIHTAIYRIAADSSDQKTVHVLPGTYSRNANQQVFPIALKSWVAVEGSGIENTHVICEYNPLFPNQTEMVFRADYETHFSLSGMSISTENSITSSALYGVRWEYMSLSDLHIYNIYPDFPAVVRVRYSFNTVWDNITFDSITTAKDGFIYCESGFNGIISNCTFRDATSTFTSNDVWASPLIWMTIDGEVTFENCIFDNFIMIDGDSHAIQLSGKNIPGQINQFNLINCRFTDFTCPSDMIVIVSANNPVINVTNCTFAGSTGNASMLYLNGLINVTNTIMYNSTLVEIRLYNYPEFQNYLSVDYSCLRRGQGGISISPGSLLDYEPTNIINNPLFIGDGAGSTYKYYLTDDSPCIDAGTPDTTGLYLPEVDLLGNPRIYNNIVDIGCYEWNGTGVDDNVSILTDKIQLSLYPNPVYANGSKGSYGFIEFTLPKKAKEPPVVEIYNLKGQRVRSLTISQSYNDLVRKAGLSKEVNTGGEFYSTVFDCKDMNSRPLATGIYLIRVKADGRQKAAKLTILR